MYRYSSFLIIQWAPRGNGSRPLWGLLFLSLDSRMNLLFSAVLRLSDLLSFYYVLLLFIPENQRIANA